MGKMPWLTGLATTLALMVTGAACAQEPPASGVSPRADAIRKAGTLRVGGANLPWLAENITGEGEAWDGPAWILTRNMRGCSASRSRPCW